MGIKFPTPWKTLIINMLKLRFARYITQGKKKNHPFEHSSSFGSALSCPIALSTMLLVSFSLYIHSIVIYWALVVQTLDGTIHWIKHSPGDKYYRNHYYAIRGIEIYFAGSAIQCLNNQGLVDSTFHLLNN